MSSNAELLQRIEQLSGAIRQHQINQTSSNSTSHRGGSMYRGRGAHRGAPILRGSSWTRGGGRGGTVHRSLNNTTSRPIPPRTHHKTLVLNQPRLTSSTLPSTTATTTTTTTTKNASYPSTSSLFTHTQPTTAARSPVNPRQPSIPPLIEPKRVSIDGASFLVKGRKLIREDRLGARPAKLPATGSHVLVSKRLIHGRRDNNRNMVLGQIPPPVRRKIVKKVKVQRSKRGNMILMREPEGYVRQGRSGKSLVLKTKRTTKRYCGIFTRYGKCPKGPRCTFLHDPNHRAICPRFLQDRCRKSASECRLSHTPNPNIMPHCVHFQRGRCTNSECIFMHVRVRPDAPVCRAFAMEGYCSKGLECREKHVHVCPEFAETGKCSNANCRLPHVARRSATETENSKSAAGVVRPGSWVSAAYFHAQKDAKRKAAEEKQQKMASMQLHSAMHHKQKLQQQQQQKQQQHIQQEGSAKEAVTKLSREKEEEEEGFVRLFDDSDDDEEGWAQYSSRPEDSQGNNELRFNENDVEEESDSEEEIEEEEEAEGGSGSGSEDDYEEYEIVDGDGDTIIVQT